MNMPGGGEAAVGFSDFLVSGTNDTSFFGGNITIALNNGSIAQDRVDDMIRRIMTPYFFLGQDQGFPAVDASSYDLNFWSGKHWPRVTRKGASHVAQKI